MIIIFIIGGFFGLFAKKRNEQLEEEDKEEDIYEHPLFKGKLYF